MRGKLFIYIFATMKLSIIVPVYNVRATLRRCTDSITGQGIGDFELLLVDDGSTDGSGRLADEIAAADGRITVLHKPNGGLSDARNYGLDRCRGDYVAFADSDDEIAPGTLAHLTETIEAHPEYDILEYPVLERPGTPTEHLYDPGRGVYRDPLDWLARHGLSHCWAWNKIYRRTLFDGVRFPMGKTYEDVYALAALLKQRPLTATTDRGLYLYHWNGAGIVASSGRNLEPLLEAQMSLVAELGIDTRRRRWHRLYLDMLNSQLHAYAATGRVMLGRRFVVPGRYGGGAGNIVKTLLADALGVRLTCMLFKRFYIGKES